MHRHGREQRPDLRQRPCRAHLWERTREAQAGRIMRRADRTADDLITIAADDIDEPRRSALRHEGRRNHPLLAVSPDGRGAGSLALRSAVPLDGDRCRRLSDGVRPSAARPCALAADSISAARVCEF